MSAKIDYTYLRLKKAEHLKKWYNPGICKKEDLTAEAYDNATILPLKKLPGDTLLFGRGGVVSREGEYVQESAVKDRIQGMYDFTPPPM